MKITERNTCRASSGPLIDVLNMGEFSISCFPTSLEPLPKKHPLILSLNEESGLVQLRHSVNPDDLYSQYWYMSGVNQSMTNCLHSIVKQARLRSLLPLNPRDIVVDIASNDGTLLDAYPKDLTRVGIDPAKNIIPKSCDIHINTYFNASAYKGVLGGKKAKIVTSIAMFYDIEDPIQFCLDVKEILHEMGLWIMELSYLPLMLKQNSFDTICAEHLGYYSLTSLEYVLSKAGLEVEDMEQNSVNGGSFRLYIRHKGVAREQASVKIARQNERSMKICERETYSAFKMRIEKNREEMLCFLREEKAKGKLIIGYGASTKGNAIMDFYGLDRELIPFVADRNPIKWGRHTVTKIPIISEEEARKMDPDYFFTFPYHFMNEFLVREQEFIARGGKFISPVPTLTLFP